MTADTSDGARPSIPPHPGKDRPVLFSGPMIRAIIDGRKTKTRRLLTRLAGKGAITEFGLSDTSGYDWHFRDAQKRWHDVSTGRLLELLPWRVGDRLWVREAFGITIKLEPVDDWPGRPHSDMSHVECKECEEALIYRADGEWEWCDGDGFHSGVSYWKPSIHMPRWASRLTLIVESVKVERLKDINDADAIAEGIISELVECADGVKRDLWFGVPFAGCVSPRRAFFDLWDSINNPRGLCADDNSIGVAANPWVCAISFRTIKANIDSVEARNV